MQSPTFPMLWITGMKDISFLGVLCASPTYGTAVENDLVRSKLTVILGLSIVIEPLMCVSTMLIVSFV